MMDSRAWLLGLFTLGWSATPLVTVTAQPTEAKSDSVKAKRGPFRAVHEADAVLVPAQSTEISFSPKAYQGELRVAEVAAHGSLVRQGDVVLRIEDEAARDLVRAAEWAARTAERGLADARARQKEFDGDTERDLARAEQELAFAEKTLKGYREVERPLEKEEHEQRERSYKHSIADQEDEIAQLGKMYKEDQLTEETEEIVLKRSKRNLEEMKKRLELFLKRHVFREEYSESQQREALENAVKDKRKVVRDLRRGRETAKVLSGIDVEKAEHEAAAALRRLERLKDDLDRLTLRAPHDGIVLHGTVEERVAVTLLKRHAVVMPHAAILTIARPGPLKARFSLKEKDRFRIEAGMAVTVLPEALADRRFAGSLEPVSGFPLPDNTWNAHVNFGHADERLQPLLKAKVIVTLVDTMDALTVPVGAVFRRGERAICYVKGKSPFGIITRSVTAGPDDGKHIVIREGLAEGDEVLLQEPPQ